MCIQFSQFLTLVSFSYKGGDVPKHEPEETESKEGADPASPAPRLRPRKQRNRFIWLIGLKNTASLSRNLAFT